MSALKDHADALGVRLSNADVLRATRLQGYGEGHADGDADGYERGFEAALTLASSQGWDDPREPPSEDADKLSRAVRWLRDALAEGPRPTREIEEAAVPAGHALKTLERARARLGVKSTKARGRRGAWLLSLPE